MGRHAAPESDDTVVDLAAVAADDAMIDAIGAHRAMAGADPTLGAAGTDLFEVATPTRSSGPDGSPRFDDFGDSDQLTGMLRIWRDDLTASPLPDSPAVERVAAALATPPDRRRSLRPVMGIAAAIFILLAGSAVVGSRTARPGDMLWPVTQVLWAERADSLVAGDTARVAIGEARDALVVGRTSEASSALAVASTVLPRVAPRDGHEKIQADLDALYAELDRVARGTAEAGGPATDPAEPASTGDPSFLSPSASVGSTPGPSTAGSTKGSSSAPATGTTSGKPPASSPPGSTTPPATSGGGIPPVVTPPVTTPPPGTPTPTPTPPTGSSDPTTEPSTPTTESSDTPTSETPTSETTATSDTPTSDPATTSETETSVSDTPADLTPEVKTADDSGADVNSEPGLEATGTTP